MSPSRYKPPIRGPMPIRESIRVILYTLRYYTKRECPSNPLPVPELHIPQVKYLEIALRCHFPYEILACFANQDNYLNESGFDIKNVIDFTSIIHELGCSDAWVSIGADPDGLVYYCVNRKNKRKAPVTLFEFDTEDQSWNSCDLSTWLRKILTGPELDLNPEIPLFPDWEPPAHPFDDFRPQLI